MKILVINTGSSSIKYELFDMDRHEAAASGTVERIGEKSSRLIHKGFFEGGETCKREKETVISDHHEGLTLVVDMLMDPENGVIREKAEIGAVGHRVVHGGEAFHATTLIDEKVMEAIRENIPLAPLHNPSNLMGIEVARAIFPDAPQVAVFDTAFHQTIPAHAYLYAIPYGLYEKDRVRRYGFHGTSHAYVAEKAAEFMGRALKDLDLITIHLGNGASMAALKRGRSIDTTMGMTPLAGLVMGTRCGDVDPALPFFLADHLGMSLKEIDSLLNKESGLRGICGSNDMREVIEKKEAGDRRAEIALEIYAYRIKKYIGAYYAVLGNLEGIVFTAGIGENAPLVRELCCRGLEMMGIRLDGDRNNRPGDGIREISSLKSDVKVLVVPTNEELRIAQETESVIRGKGGGNG
jgi:acetate kinase